MDYISLNGPTYFLRTLQKTDVSESYLKWLNDPEINQCLEVRFETHSLESLRKWVEQFDNVNKFLFGIYTTKDNKFIGTMTLVRTLNPRHGLATFGYLIGDNQFWGKGAAMAGIELLLDYAFHHLGIRKVCGGAYETNVASLFNCKKLGMQEEGRLRAHILFEGQYIDQVLFGILKTDWEQRRRPSLFYAKH